MIVKYTNSKYKKIMIKIMNCLRQVSVVLRVPARGKRTS